MWHEGTRAARLAVIAVAMSVTSLAWPAGGGGSGGGGGGGEFAPVDPDYQAAMAAVKKEDWELVVERMGPYAQRNPGSADAWNELGHAFRRLGDLDNAFKHYDKALKIDPKHKGAHEYLGEAYLQIGDLARAEQELTVLDRICFLPCEEYSDLKEKIKRYKASKPIAAK